MTNRAGMALSCLSIAAAAAITGCSSSGSSGSSVTYDALKKASSGACPVDLDGAARAAGATTAGTTTGSVDVGEALPASTVVDPSSSTPFSVPPRAEGVVVECRTDLGSSGSLHLTLYASQGESAAFIMLPQLQAEARLASKIITDIADDLGSATVGKPVTLPADVTDVVYVTTKVSGAESAVYILSSDGSAGLDVLDKVATELDDRIH